MIRAAGVLFLTPDRQALFLKRGPGSDHPGEWCVPGGQTEDDETAEQTAIRETLEEAGVKVSPEALRLHSRNISNAEVGSPLGATTPAATVQGALPTDPVAAAAPVGLPLAPPGDAVSIPGVEVDFTTFLARVKAPFMLTLCEEHTGYAWASIDAPPEPLHPGVRIALARLDMDELGVARAMAAGDLTSPQVYENVTLFCMRITGTGVAYRSSLDEFVHRPPEYYLNDEFLARCAGLQVIREHPEYATLDSDEFGNRTIGSIMFAYIQGNEVWGVAKIYDDKAIAEMLDGTMASTSPTVVFKGKDNQGLRMTMEGGSALLVEPDPYLLDHLAICPAGVWDKGGEPVGVAVADSEAAPPKVHVLDFTKLQRLDRDLTLLNVRMSNHAALRR